MSQKSVISTKKYSKESNKDLVSLVLKFFKPEVRMTAPCLHFFGRSVQKLILVLENEMATSILHNSPSLLVEVRLRIKPVRKQENCHK